MWLTIINKPFPLSTWRWFWLRGLGFGLFVFLFLYLFQPFQLNFYTNLQLLKASGVYGLITALVILSGGFLLIKVIAPRIDEEKWTLGKQILWLSGLMCCISLLNIVGTQLMHSVVLPFSFYVSMLKWVCMLGVLPIAISELIAYNHYLRQHMAGASELSNIIDAGQITQPSYTSQAPLPAQLPVKEQASIAPIAMPATTLQLRGENNNELLELDADNLLAVQSVDNYITVYWLQNGELQQQMLRNTLTNIVSQTAHISYLFRSHRGWLVNIRQVTHVDGNAQGYRLTLHGLGCQVPVSRSNIAGYKQMVASITKT